MTRTATARWDLDRVAGPWARLGDDPASALDRLTAQVWAQRKSHHARLRPVRALPGLPRRGVDLLVVPTSRPDPADRPGVRTALRLAGDGVVGKLVIICSKEAAEGVPALVELLGRELKGSVPALVVTTEGRCTGVPVFGVDRLALTSAWRRYGRGDDKCVRKANEVGTKRNLGLLLARRLGARHVLFLDDDIQADAALAQAGDHPAGIPAATLDADAVSAAVCAVEGDGLPAVGWLLRGYDDNSVVCRARSLAGEAQEQFIGGGALLVGTGPDVAFFPAIYNEDWLFLLALRGRDGRPAREFGCAGVVRQDRYDGFRPRRAKSEELGEILGEGLMGLLHHHLHPLELDGSESWRGYWNKVVDGRRCLVETLHDWFTHELKARPDDELPTWERATSALEAAKDVHTALVAHKRRWIDDLVRYREAWLADLDQWAVRLTAEAPATLHDLVPDAVAVGTGAARAFGLQAPGPAGPAAPARADDGLVPAPRRSPEPWRHPGQAMAPESGWWGAHHWAASRRAGRTRGWAALAPGM